MNRFKYQYRLSGAVAAIGGLLWSAWVVISAARPLLPPDGYRDTEDISVMMGLAMLFMAIGVVAIYRRRTGHATWLGKIGLYASLLGASMGFIGNVLITFYGTNLILVPIFFGGGSILFMLGIVLTGISVIQGDSLPAWSGWLLIGGVILAFTGNENSSTIWLLLSVGVVWVIIGLFLFLPLPTSLRRAEDQA